MIKSAAPYLLVGDIERSAEYYDEVLGFGYEKLWGEPPSFVMVNRNDVTIMLKEATSESERRPVSTQGGAWDAYIWVNDADDLYTEFETNDAIIHYEPKDMVEYSIREFAVEDPNKNIIAFGSHLE